MRIAPDGKKRIRLSVALIAIHLIAATTTRASFGLTPDDAQAPASSRSHSAVTSRRRPISQPALPPSARRFYESTWGIDIVGVKAAESGAMLRFSYRVLDPQKAQALNDKKATPYLYDITSHVRLEVPSMEKVGQLRQTSAVEADHIYWMVFSNKERIVKPGARVDIRIGQFLAQGLLVE